VSLLLDLVNTDVYHYTILRIKLEATTTSGIQYTTQFDY